MITDWLVQMNCVSLPNIINLPTLNFSLTFLQVTEKKIRPNTKICLKDLDIHSNHVTAKNFVVVVDLSVVKQTSA